MICPHCLSDQTEVYNTRLTRSAHQVWRRRRCWSCRKTFTTYERPDLSFVRINGHKYSRARLYQSILPCFADERARLRYVDECIETIETKLVREPNSDVSSERLIILVSQTLKPLSIPALLRYLAAVEQPENARSVQKLLRLL